MTPLLRDPVLAALRDRPSGGYLTRLPAENPSLQEPKKTAVEDCVPPGLAQLVAYLILPVSGTSPPA
jgi:hypothetical protein